MRSRYPCPDRCSCHSAGPSTRPAATTAHHTATIAGPSTWNRTAPALFLAASLAAPALAAPAPAPAPRPDLAFLYPALERRVTDAGQAPDDPSTGWFAPQNVEVDDLVAAGLSIKFRYDPSARAAAARHDNAGAWVLDDYWELHGKRFGPHTTTVDISDDPLPTTTQSATSTIPSATATATRSTIPSLLAIESSLPTGWSDPDYRNSGIYRIPIVISFAVVIALMIGFLIGALVYRRAQRRKRRRKKEQRARAADQHDDDAATQPSLREKAASKSLSARVGRALRASKHNSELRRRLTRQSTNDDMSPTDAEHGQQEAEDMREVAERTALEERVKSWARRSAVWRVQARMGMRRKMGKGQRRGLDVPADINEHGNDDPVRSHTSSRPPSPVQSRTSRDEPRPPTVVITNVDPDQAAAVNVTPTVPTYSSMSGSGTGGSQPGSSTDTSPTPSTSHDAHPDATPSDEPAYEYGSGLPPAYRRGEGMTEVRRGKMPMREETDVEEPREGIRREEAREVQARNWTALDAYAFASEEGGQERCITAHVATDDKQVLERLREMRGAPEAEPEDGLGAGAVPREEDVFGAPGVEAEPLGESSQPQVFPPPPDSQTRVLPREDESVIPAPPEKTGSGPVARYVEADMSLPGYLEGRACSAEGTMGPSAPPEELGPLAPLDELGPSAPPEEFRPSATSADFSPSAPPEDLTPSAPEFGPSSPPEFIPSAPLAPSAPPLEGDEPTPESDLPKPSAPPAEHESSMPRLRHLNSSSPLLEHVEQHQ